MPMPATTDVPVFTLGYQMRSIDEYIDELLEAGVDLVVDVRETPWSHKRGFSKTKLREALREAGIDYVHLKFAGNPKALRRNASSHAACLADYDRHIQEQPGIISRFADQLRDWTGAGVKACLLCYERHPDDCHRAVLLNRVLEEMEVPVVVEHLGPEGAERFT